LKKHLLAFIALLTSSAIAYADCRIDTINFYSVSANGSSKTLTGRHIHTYDSKDSLLTKLELLVQNNVLVNNRRTTQTFNANGKKLTTVVQLWNSTTNDWQNNSKDENVYSGNNRTEQIQWLWSTSINNWYENKRWSYTYPAQQSKPSKVVYTEQTVNKTQTFSTYDANLNETERTNQTWTNGAWVNSNRWLYTYDASNRLTSETPEIWNSQYSQWSASGQKTTYSYNASGELLLTTYLQYNDQILNYEAVIKIGNTYGVNGITQVLREQYYGPGVGWKGIYRETWTYSQGFLSQKLFETLNPQTEQYDATGKEEYVNNTAGLITQLTKSEWVAQGPGGFFRPTMQQMFNYNSSNKLIRKTLFYPNQLQGILEPTNEWIYEYHTTDDLIAYEVKGNFNGAVFVVRNREEYSCGERQTLGVASIEESKLNVYPNPGSSKIMLETVCVNANISITDLLGKQVYFLKNASSKTVVETSSFSNGIYFVQIESNA
jgi:hypothetical protein